MTSIYDFMVKKNDGQEVSMADYRGKVLLIVNTATKCGFTPQYEGLQKIYETYHERGFEILDFPSNQFANQAPGTDEEINHFCQLNYGTSFDRFAKIDVNGENADPLFKFLKNARGGVINGDIKWNFTKFLIDKEGNVVNRYSSQKKPERISEDIEKLLEDE